MTAVPEDPDPLAAIPPEGMVTVALPAQLLRELVRDTPEFEETIGDDLTVCRWGARRGLGVPPSFVKAADRAARRNIATVAELQLRLLHSLATALADDAYHAERERVRWRTRTFGAWWSATRPTEEDIRRIQDRERHGRRWPWQRRRCTPDP